MVFVNDDWTASPCETEGITPLGDGTALINCHCTVPGYIAVFDSLEGAQASLARNRKNSSVPEYMPSNFNSRIQTQSSCVLHDDLHEPNSGLLVRDPYGVPIPARYKEPTENEISMTQPIPQHIVRNKN